MLGCRGRDVRCAGTVSYTHLDVYKRQDDDIIGRWGLTPLEYETWNPAMKEGDLGMIGLQPSQMYDMRPFPGKGHTYHGDIDNLYFIGCCGHPGGGIAAGARPGAFQILEDYGVDFRDVLKK